MWHQRFVLRLGRALLIYLLNPRDYQTRELVNKGVGEVKDTSVVAKEKIVEWYWMYSKFSLLKRRERGCASVYKFLFPSLEERSCTMMHSK